MRRPLFFVVAAALPLLLYARTVGFDFVHADDADLIAGNQSFLTDLGNVPRAFARSYFEVEGDVTEQKTYYRPVAIASFMLDAARGGAKPAAYHATNVVLHAAVTCLLIALAIAWGARAWAAFAVALLFAVHPVNAQAVAWIAGRNDLLLALFGLASLLAWSAIDVRAIAAANASAIAIHTLCFALALFSKESGLAFPAIAVLHQRLVWRKALAGAHWVALGCDAVVIAIWAALRASALSGMPSDFTLAALGNAVLNAPQLLVHTGKVIAPVRLNVSPAVDAPGVLLGIVALGVFAWAVWRWCSRGLRVFCACWVLAFLLPPLIVPGLPAYEHRVYVPLLGGVLAMGLAVSERTPRRGRSPLLAVCTAALVLIGALATNHRLDVFRDPFAYWTDATRDEHFGSIAHVNLGQLHEAAGRIVEARREYLRALERDPNTPKAHNNLGVVLMALNEPQLAVVHFREETTRHPWNADAWFNLGLWTEMHGRAADARQYYERAIQANPAYRPAYEKLGR